MPVPLPAPPSNTGQTTHDDLEQTKVYLDVLRRLIEGVLKAHFDTDTPASDETEMLLLVNNSGVTTIRRVSIGANDSGGAGFAVLRVPN